MAQYVDIEDVIVAFKNAPCDIQYFNRYDMTSNYGHSDQQIDDIIRTLPIANVRENKRGEYIGAQTKFKTVAKRRCSACGIYSEVWDFCGHCGADMRGDNNG